MGENAREIEQASGQPTSFVADHGQFDRACRVCTTPDECDDGGCLAYEICACGEREDRCDCRYCETCGEKNCCEDSHG